MFDLRDDPHRDDAVRDALAALRAAAAEDVEALSIVAVHSSYPELTIAVLATWFASAAEKAGLDLPAGVDLWQREAGL